MGPNDNRRALERSAAAWNAGDLDGYLRIYAPTIVHHGLDPRGPLDAAGNRASYEATFAAFDGSQLTVEAIVADGDMLSSRFRLDGIHSGSFMGIPATGATIVMHGQNMMRFDGGRVVERWTIADVATVLHQLGARFSRDPRRGDSTSTTS